MQYMRLSEIERRKLLAALAGMKTFLREAFGALAPAEALAPGPGGGFSPVEQVWHLADLEREGFAVRIRRLQTETDPHLADFDGAKIARERNYRALPLEAGLRAFEAARDANLRLLETLPNEAWTRGGTQEGVGAVTLCDMPAFLRQHDQAHIAEIEEWKKFVARS
jgi:hypothetical protein